MSRLARTMAFYAAYHRHPHNKLTHAFGVPTIVFSLILAATYARFEIGGMEISLALILVAGLIFYYVSLDGLIGGAMAVVSVPVLWLAEQVASLPATTAAAIGIAAFVGGWAVQLLGHWFEGNKPALTANLWQIFMAPLFLMAEAFFALGLRKDVEAEVNRLVESGIAGPGATGRKQGLA